MNINTILSQIELGSIALPAFQRGYVWNRDQVHTLMDSLCGGAGEHQAMVGARPFRASVSSVPP